MVVRGERSSIITWLWEWICEEDEEDEEEKKEVMAVVVVVVVPIVSDVNFSMY